MDFRIKMEDAAWSHLAAVEEAERNRLVRAIHELARAKSIGPSEEGTHQFKSREHSWTIRYRWDSDARLLRVPDVHAQAR